MKKNALNLVNAGLIILSLGLASCGFKKGDVVLATTQSLPTAQDDKAPEGVQNPETDLKAPTEPSLKPGQVLAGHGYHDLNSEGIPAAVKKSALSVFEMRTLSVSSKDQVRFVDVSTDAKAADVRSDIQEMDAAHLDKLDKIVLTQQVERCVRFEDADKKKICPIIFDIRRSSGFLLDQGDQLWVSAHGVAGFIKALETYSENTLQSVVENKIPLKIFIFDSSGKLVVDPFVDGFTIAKFPTASTGSKAKNKFFAADNDYLQLKISKVVGAPLTRAAQKSAVNDVIYLAGYPKDRGGFMFSVGQIKDSSVGTAKDLDLGAMLFYTAEATASMAGGPVLNGAGEVLGLHAGGRKAADADDLSARISRGVLLPK